MTPFMIPGYPSSRPKSVSSAITGETAMSPSFELLVKSGHTRVRSTPEPALSVEKLTVETNDTCPAVGDGPGYFQFDGTAHRRVNMVEADDTRFGMNFRLIKSRDLAAHIRLQGTLEDGR